jgi:hypothetical protein
MATTDSGRNHDDEVAVSPLPIDRLADRPSALRALRALADNPGRQMTAAQIAEEGDFSPKTWYAGVEELLLSTGLVRAAGKAGNARCYRLADTEALRGFKHFRSGLQELVGEPE